MQRVKIGVGMITKMLSCHWFDSSVLVVAVVSTGSIASLPSRSINEISG